MLKLSKFRNNHHPSEARILGKITQRGFSVSYNLYLIYINKLLYIG